MSKLCSHLKRLKQISSCDVVWLWLKVIDGCRFYIQKISCSLTTRGLPVAEQIRGCRASVFTTPFPTLFTCPRMDMEPADDLPEAEVDEANGTEPTPLEDVLFGTSGGMSSSMASSSSSSISRRSSSLSLRYSILGNS